MAWEYTDVNGLFWSTGTEKLKRDAALGHINRHTEVVSTTTGKRRPAGEIKGLVWSEAVSDVLVSDPPIHGLQAVVSEPAFKYKPRRGPVPSANPGFFDVHFREAITPKLVSLLWQIWLALVIFTFLLTVGMSCRLMWSSEDSLAVRIATCAFVSICGVFISLFSSIVVRMILEGAVVLFRIADYLKQISER